MLAGVGSSRGLPEERCRPGTGAGIWRSRELRSEREGSGGGVGAPDLAMPSAWPWVSYSTSLCLRVLT